MTAPTFLELLSEAAGVFNQLASDLTPLTWYVCPDEVRGQVDVDATDEEASQILTAWADRLGLALVDDCLPGAREYAAARSGWRLVVWGVTDTARWAEDTRAASEPVWGWRG
ncbi:hypothetical protein [Kribbella sp. CA-247076]|uniref:hypothetical protein n=1 Tax=Kribbella sp. CA-247076 TaxID=3239941 RepID=UPI003D8CAA42